MFTCCCCCLAAPAGIPKHLVDAFDAEVKAIEAQQQREEQEHLYFQFPVLIEERLKAIPDIATDVEVIVAAFDHRTLVSYCRVLCRTLGLFTKLAFR